MPESQRPFLPPPPPADDLWPWSGAARDRSSPLARRLSLAIIGLTCLGLVALAFDLARQSAEVRISAETAVSAQSRLQAVESVLATQRAVSVTLASDGMVIAALRSGDTALALQVSEKLAQLHHETGSSILYLLGMDGIAIAASNHDLPESFVGGDYAFRNYFTLALRDGRALEYALGINSLKPGLYLSSRIVDAGETIGVIVVKMEFTAMEAAWARSADRTFVIDRDNRVVLTAEPALRFGPPPSEGSPIRLSMPVAGTNGWQMITTASAAGSVQGGLIGAGAMSGFLLICLTLILRAGRARRIARDRADAEAHDRHLLEQAVALRTAALTAEAAERRQAEERLAQMQGELVQANKLATLGQVTAGLAHEVNQPLGTIRLLADNGLILLETDPAETAENLRRISSMTDRIAQITSHLRGFARKATGEIAGVRLQEVIDASLLLTASRQRAAGAVVSTTGVPPTLQVRVEAVRLEQVLVNLIQNANEAMEGHPDPRIAISVTYDDEQVLMRITDNGPGFAPGMFETLFMPFATSKKRGLGLGLVIARDIARDLGGELIAIPPRAGEGASFLLTLVRA